MQLENQPKLVQDLWYMINYDDYAWIPIWGVGRCGKSTLAMLLMYYIYEDWDMVLNAIVFNLSQTIYKIKKGEPRLFPTVTKPCHMRVPILLIDDFAAQCGKAKTQHEKSWDLFKGSFDTLGTRVGVLLGTMIEPTSPTEQLLLKYTHEIKVEKRGPDERWYKYDKCTRQQDYRGWKHRQKKDWIEEQEFGRVPLDVYKQYDEMRLSLVDEVLITVIDSMSEDTVGRALKRLEPLCFNLLEYIKTWGPKDYHKIEDQFGDQTARTLASCKARGLIVPIRHRKNWYTYDITEVGVDVLNAYREAKEKKEQPQTPQIPHNIIT